MATAKYVVDLDAGPLTVDSEGLITGLLRTVGRGFTFDRLHSERGDFLRIRGVLEAQDAASAIAAIVAQLRKEPTGVDIYQVAAYEEGADEYFVERWMPTVERIVNRGGGVIAYPEDPDPFDP